MKMHQPIQPSDFFSRPSHHHPSPSSQLCMEEIKEQDSSELVDCSVAFNLDQIPLFLYNHRKDKSISQSIIMYGT